MARPAFSLRARIRVHHAHAQWGTVIGRTESVDDETRYLIRLDPVNQAVLQPELYGEADLVAANATEPPRDPFATEDATPVAKAKPCKRKTKR